MDDISQPETSQPDDAVVSPHLRREYWCFISYRHADNKEPGRQWATWLHQALETYEVPADLVGTRNARGDVIPERIFPVFRDEEELPADARLSTPIEAALQWSRFLVVLCSPKAVQSEFVAGEILRFKQLGKQDRILAAILEGEPTGGADLTRECFPKPLRFAVDEQGRLTDELAEPIAADFRLPDGTPGWTSPTAFREALKAAGVPEKAAAAQVSSYMQQQNLMLLKIVAGVLGVPLGVLTQRDKAYQLQKQQQRAKVLRRWLGVISVLAVIALVAGIVAVRNAREAQAQRDKVAAQSKALSDTLGISYFHEGSARLRDTRTAREGLAYLARAVREHGHPAAARRLLTFLQQREVWILEDAGALPPKPAQEPEKVTLPPNLEPPAIKEEPGKFDQVVKGPNGLLAVSWCEDTDSPNGSNHPGAGLHHFRVWDANGKALCPWIKADHEAESWVGNISRMVFSPDGAWLAVTVERWRQPEYLQVWDFRRGVQIGETLEATGEDPNYQGAVFTTVAFAPVRPENETRHTALMAGSSRGDACWMEIVQTQDPADTFAQEVARVPHRASIRAIHLVPGTRELLVTSSDDGEVCFTRRPMLRGGPGAPIVKLDRPVLAIRSDAAGIVTLETDGRQFRALEMPALSFAGDIPSTPKLEVLVEEDHQVKVTRSTKPDEVVFEQNFAEKIVKANAQSDPDSFSVQAEDGRVQVYRIESGKARLVATGRDREVVIDPEHAAHKLALRGIIADLRMGGKAGTLIVVTRDHQYQVFELATAAAISRLLDERILFTEGNVASDIGAVMLSSDATSLLTRSQHWEPPNAMLSWTTLWDCASGEPLTDRIAFADDGSSESTPNRALFVSQAAANVEGMLIHQTKPEMFPLLADIGESLAGLKLDAAGELHAVEQSKARLSEWLQKLAERVR